MLPVLSLPCKFPAVFPPLPSSPHPSPLCQCHLEVTATAHPASHPPGAHQGFLWAVLDKAMSCQALLISRFSSSVLLQQDLPQAWGDGALGG